MNRINLAASALLAAALFTAKALPLESGRIGRVAVGGKASAMVADVVYLFPQAAERIVAVAGVDQGLGVFLDAVDPGFAAKPSFDRAAGVEVYASLKPDLVIMKSAMRKSMASSFDALGIRQLYLELETPEDYLDDLVLLGKAFGDTDRAAALVAYYKKTMDTIGSRIASIAEKDRPRVLVLQASSSGGGSYEVPPKSWMQTILSERAGGVPVWKDANPGSGWARVGTEQIAAWNPDAVFVISYKESATKVAVAFRSDPRLAGLKAVKAGKVFAFPQDFYSWDQPDTRWILGLEWMAKKLHPPLFPELSIPAEAEKFFAFCYGLGRARYEAIVKPRLSGDYGD